MAGFSRRPKQNHDGQRRRILTALSATRPAFRPGEDPPLRLARQPQPQAKPGPVPAVAGSSSDTGSCDARPQTGSPVPRMRQRHPSNRRMAGSVSYCRGCTDGTDRAGYFLMTMAASHSSAVSFSAAQALNRRRVRLDGPVQQRNTPVSEMLIPSPPPITPSGPRMAPAVRNNPNLPEINPHRPTEAA